MDTRDAMLYGSEHSTQDTPHMEQHTSSQALAPRLDFILEPLSAATQTALTPLRIATNDYLFVSMDATGRRFVMELKSCRRGADGSLEELLHPYPSRGAEEMFNRLPERQWLGRHNWNLRFRYIVAATDFTALVVHHCWPKDRLVFSAGGGLPESEEAKELYRLLLLRFASQSARAATAATFKLTRKVPPVPKDWPFNTELPLADYQEVATMLSLGQSGYGLFMDRGTGKTPTVIQRVCLEGIRLRRERDEMYRCLVVCPPQVRSQWQSEVERFATTQGKVTVVRGGQLKRVKQLIHGITTEPDCAFSIVVIGYDSLVSSLEHFVRVPWDLGVADESHMFKSPTTDRWGAMLQLRDAAKARMILTGTPIGNSLMDLWSQLEFLGDGLSGFQSYKNFRRFHGVWQSVGGYESGVQRLVGVKNIALLQERLTRLTFAVTKNEAGLKLPDKVYDSYEVQMTKDQAEIYRKVATQLAIEIEDRLSGEINSMTIEHILTSLLRLAQITSGHLRWNPVVDPDTGAVLKPGRVEQIARPNPKVEALIELLTSEDRDPLGKTIVWCCFVPDIEVIGERLTAAGIQNRLYYGSTSEHGREEAVAAFNGDPAMRVLVTNPQTAGEGLNLIGYDPKNPEDSPTYCDHEIFFSQNWSAIGRSQAEDRAHRRGTRMPVRVTDLVVMGTIDEEIRARVRMKQAMAATATDVRAILRSILDGLGGDR